MSIKLTDNAMRQFRVAKVFQEVDELTVSLDFSRDGRRLLTCNPSKITIYDCGRQAALCQVNLQHYWPKVACFAQQDTRVLHSASKYDCAIRCLDLETRHCVRLFSGHSRFAHLLLSQPGSQDVFISAGRDDQVYVWDFRSTTYTHHLKDLQRPLCAFDPAGLVFATSTGTERIEIYDVRMLGVEPCQKFDYQFSGDAKWTQLQFAPDGKSLLLSTDQSWCFSVNAFDGKYLQSYTGYANDKRELLEATYSPDSQFVLSGADAGRIHIWRADSGNPVAVLKGNNVGAVRCLRFNPQLTMFVSSDQLIVFWMPSAQGNYEWVDPPQPGETPIWKTEDYSYSVKVPQPKSMPKPMVDVKQFRKALCSSGWIKKPKRLRSEETLAALTNLQDSESSMEEGEISD
ncbi:WD repeat-containing protein 82 [Drosophila serrata]|uniref:WD repeat-containing protein 82 n=1 Tax=Drosophila serrata TaxID=7274 RepID=UPI000A1D2A86|nr:WD repeat-containing protein 82 [Drosophila serrata]